MCIRDSIFGSEIKSILQHPAVTRELNREALAQYLTFQYSVLPETFFRGIYRLPPAHYLLWEKGAFSIHRYWEPVFNADESMTFEDAVNRIDAVMQDSIAAHKISDTEAVSYTHLDVYKRQAWRFRASLWVSSSRAHRGNTLSGDPFTASRKSFSWAYPWPIRLVWGVKGYSIATEMCIRDSHLRRVQQLLQQ